MKPGLKIQKRPLKEIADPFAIQHNDSCREDSSREALKREPVRFVRLKDGSDAGLQYTFLYQILAIRHSRELSFVKQTLTSIRYRAFRFFDQVH